MREKVYLDHCATEPVDKEVWQVIEESIRDNWYNCSSRYSEGERCGKILEGCEQRIKRSLGAEDYDVVFTSGSSESASMVGKISHGKGICGVWEHKCVTKNCEKKVESIKELEKEISSGKGKFVYLMGVNNVVGERYDVGRLGGGKKNGKVGKPPVE